jgi:replication-associated recombination protein RarA
MAVLEIRNQEPLQPSDLIGSEIQKTASYLWKSIDEVHKGEDYPLALVITGAPGIGKTTLANMLALKITGSPYAVTTENGKEVGVQRVRDVMDSMNNSTLFSTTGHQCWIINEGDKITDDGQVAFLSMLDACPTHYHVILTSNEDLDNWSERFQTRFEVYNINAPSDEEIAQGLEARLKPEKWNKQIADMWPRVAETYAERCNGNVREAIMEIRSWKRQNKIS